MGIIKGKGREVPAFFPTIKDDPSGLAHLSLPAGKLWYCIYQKNVLYSTMYNGDNVDRITGKSKVILMYNIPKCRVDTV